MLFLGLLFDRNEEQIIASKSQGGFLQNQVNMFQWNCIDGFYQNGVSDISIVNALPVGTFPKMYSDAKIPFKKWSYNGNNNFQLGSFNIPVLKQYGRYRGCKKLIKQIDDNNILIYSPYQPFLKAIKKLDKKFNVTLIVPDLPEFYDYSNVSRVKRILRKINNYSINKCIDRVDNFVLLTEAMKNPLKVGNRPYTIVEGIANAKQEQLIRKKNPGKKIILYTGSLNKQFGIHILIEAFKRIPNNNYELWVCGGGDFQDSLKKHAEIDNRIKFFGFVTKDKVSAMQAQATVLVNPRQNTGEYTKYSFPSKTMEYLLSGVPVIAYKLDGTPDEYDKYFYYVKDDSSEELSNALLKVCEDTTGHYELMAKQAVEFISTKKDSKTQSKKILDLMEGNSGN